MYKYKQTFLFLTPLRGLHSSSELSDGLKSLSSSSLRDLRPLCLMPICVGDDFLLGALLLLWNKMDYKDFHVVYNNNSNNNNNNNNHNNIIMTLNVYLMSTQDSLQFQ